MPAWENAPIVGDGKKAAWESAPVVQDAKSKPDQAKAPSKSSDPSFLDNAKSMLFDKNPQVGMAETGLNLATGAVVTPIAGLAGLGSAAVKSLTGYGNTGAETVENLTNKLVYKPQTTAGKKTTNAVTYPFQLLAKGGEKAGDFVLDKTGSPALATATDTAIQSVPAVVSKALKGPAATRLAAEEESLAKLRAENAKKDANLQSSRDKGYVLPPAEADSGGLNGFFQAAVGDVKTEQAASMKNQRVTNTLIKKELGIPEHEDLSRERLQEVREDAGKAYSDVKKAVPILKTTDSFKAALKDSSSKFSEARKEFPEYFKNKDIDKLIKTLSKKEFSSDAAIQLQKALRSDGNANLKAFDDPGKQALGEAQINAAKAIDNLIDENLKMRAPAGVTNFEPKLADNLNNARKTIAKSYAVEGALNDSTGNVSAQKLAKLWNKNQTLTGGLKDVAEQYSRFPKAMQNVDKFSGKADMSKLDLASAGLAASTGHGALGALYAMSRPAIRPVIMSDWYQNRFVKPGAYAPGMAYTLPADILSNPMTPIGLLPTPPKKEEQK